jgi:hypothetical protein
VFLFFRLSAHAVLPGLPASHVQAQMPCVKRSLALV